MNSETNQVSTVKKYLKKNYETIKEKKLFKNIKKNIEFII